jgi:demethylmenaquinone methyltransferase/2-methoxy-6-polyprenyl-1,4-benzoquinol methylase
MFDAIASKYDRINRLLSFGTDQAWRREAVRSMALAPTARVLDLATGTADLAIQIAKMCPTVSVVGIDPSAKMLAVAARKVERLGWGARITLQQGDAQAIDADDASFDAASIAFGIRNVPDRSRALREMARVVRPGGSVVVLELAEPTGHVVGSLARFHIHTLVPAIGGVLAGTREYRYLEASIAAFPPRERFAAMMQDAGLEILFVRPLTFGVATLFVARSGEATHARG